MPVKWRLFRSLGGSHAEVFGIRVYGSPKHWYMPAVKFLHHHAFRIQRGKRYLVSRYIRRDHMLRLRGIEGQWCDSDERMFIACFEVLGWFVNWELGPARPGRDGYRGFRLHSAGGTDETAIDLWLWYRDELPKLEAEYDADVARCYGGRLQFGPPNANGLREVLNIGPREQPKFEYDWPGTVKDQKLRELIDMRRALWT